MTNADWESEIYSFPIHPAGGTFKWTPKGLARRYAACRLRVLDWAMDAETASPSLPAHRVEAWSRLALVLPYLLLHEVGSVSSGQFATPTDPTETKTGARKLLQRRLTMAENGEYSALLHEAVANERVAHLRATAAPLRERSHLEAQEQAAARAEDGCLRTAARLLMGDAVLPRSPETADKVAGLYRMDAGPALLRRRRGAVHQIAQRQVIRRAQKARGSAHPGPAGERNSHIHSLLASPHAGKTLARWVNLWLHVEPSAAFRGPWMCSGLTPLDKGGGKPRPIVFQEALLKVATGTVVDVCSTELKQAAGEWQHGVYDKGGTIQMVWELRAAMAARPHQIITGIDCKNAFGEASRSPACRVAAQHCPTFARLLHNLWEGTDMVVHVPDGPGSKRPLIVQEGFIQGGCEAAPGFALCLREAVDAFLAAAAAAGKPCRVWAYMDDLYFQCEVADWEFLATSLREHLAGVHLSCQPAKSHCHVPEWDPSRVAAETQRFAHFANLHADGLPALGTAAEGQYAILLGPDHRPDQATSDRVDKSVRLCRHLRDLCSAPLKGTCRHPAWRILDSVVNHALSYDASVNDPDAMASHGDRLDEAVLDTAACILSAERFTIAESTQVRLSRAEGGCGMTSAADRLATAFLSTVLRLSAALPADHSPVLTQPTLLDQARRAQARLRDLGVALDQHGMPHDVASPPARELDVALDLRQPMPKRQRHWWQTINAIRARHLGAELDMRRLRSCGGTEGGAYLRAVASDGGGSLTDNEFVRATRFRLGLRVMSPGVCHHQTGGDQVKQRKVCNAPVAPDGEHAVTCKCGGTPYFAHSQGCNILLRAAIRAGYQSRREQIVPELATPACSAPQLDVEGWSTSVQSRLLIDFSIRHPTAARYSAGQCATIVAGREKEVHYGSRQGLRVRTAAMESYGRHGEDLGALLEQLADLARQRDLAFGLAPTRWLRKWRAQLSLVAARMVGRAIQKACPPDAPSLC